MATLPSEDARSLLIAEAVVSATPTADWAVFIGKMPERAPDRSVVIVDTGGLTPNPKWLIDYPAIQIRVRGKSNGYSEARNKAVRIKDELLGITSLDINGNRWVSIRMTGDIVMLGYDQSERPQFALNFDLIIQPQASADTHRQSLV
jgi:hypothetical protein